MLSNIIMEKETIIKRLTLIKYLFKIGYQQSYQFETYASFSILSFHDSIEMFLKLSAEYLGIKNDGKLSFIEYWDKIPKLTLRESMRNLNALRVSLKHKGILPAKVDIEISRSLTKLFFIESTKNIYNIDFENVSLGNLVEYENVRKYINQAQEDLNLKNYEDCLVNCAKGFEILIEEFTSTKLNETHENIIFNGLKLNKINTRSFEIDSNHKNFINEIKKAIGSIESGLNINNLGIDYLKYAKFKTLVPTVKYWADNQFDIFPREHIKLKRPEYSCEFAIDFVIDTSLHLKNLEFDFSDLIEVKHDF